MKKTSREITKILIDDITQGKLKANDQLPSEKQLEIKYGVSRAITNKVFNNLKNMDLVYSVPHKGYFVAEFFASITIPNYFKYAITETRAEDIKTPSRITKFMEDNKILLTNETAILQKMYKDNKLVVQTEVVLSKSLNLLDKINGTKSITDQLADHQILKSVIKKGVFEKDDAFEEKLQMVEYKIYYGHNEVLGVSRSVIKHEVHNYIKKELAI